LKYKSAVSNQQEKEKKEKKMENGDLFVQGRNAMVVSP
jgi:hypothetical protein